MPQLPRDIGEQIASTRSRRSRALDFVRRLFGLPPRAQPGRPPRQPD